MGDIDERLSASFGSAKDEGSLHSGQRGERDSSGLRWGQTGRLETPGERRAPGTKGGAHASENLSVDGGVDCGASHWATDRPIGSASQIAPKLKEPVEHTRWGLVGTRSYVRQDLLGGPVDSLFGQLFLSSREVVIDRASRSAAVSQYL